MSNVIAFFLVASTILSAQTFEVASVKRSAPETGSGARSTGAVPRQQEPFRISCPHVTLKAVIAAAYGVDTDNVSGPQWLEDERYDISAKQPDGASPDQTPVMLQHLLADRFHMTAHEETRPGKGFGLLIIKDVAAKGGPKLTPAKVAGDVGFIATAGSVTFTSTTMEQLARLLSSFVGNPVADETGIQGEFDITVNASMSELRSGSVSAIQDLGLKLETRATQVKFIVVDKAERVPTEN
jgi:uncharacterized protein (TIGR03435 family)